MSRRLVMVTLVALALGIAPGRALAASEFYVAAFGGIAIPVSADITLTNPSASADLTLSEVDFKNSTTFGGKIGRFFGPSLPVQFGLEASVSHFSPDIEVQTVDASGIVLGTPVTLTAVLNPVDLGATNVAAHLLVRLPTPGIKPYAGVGGGAQRLRARFIDGTSDSDWGGLFEVLAGVRVPLVPFLALFAEYTFSLSPHTIDVSSTVKEDFTLKTNQIVGGVAVHF